ncbi:MAG: hypothetical protein AAFV25_16565 [Bacteroidota bacterium]
MSTVKTTGGTDRQYLPARFRITVWSKLKPYYNELLQRPIASAIELKRWLLDKAELDGLVQQELAIRLQLQLEMPLDLRRKEAVEYMQLEICPRIASIEQEIQQKMRRQLNQELFRLYAHS